jgi:hypothetical protein
MNSLQTLCYAKKNAWMTSEMTDELGCRITTEIEENFGVLGNCAAHPHLDCLKISNWNIRPPTTHSLYSEWTWES